jgi:NitT/TauT family transport system permease protein
LGRFISQSLSADHVQAEEWMKATIISRRWWMAFITNRSSSKNHTYGGKTSAAGRLIPIVGAIVLCGVVWQAVAVTAALPAFILPGPLAVADRLWSVMADGSLIRQSLFTLGEVLAGMAAGVTSAAFLGYLLSKSRLAERILSPYIVASQAIPVVAIAPLLFIWLGSGFPTKVLICALIVFFPVLVNFVVGLRSVSTNLRELMRSLGATRWQNFRYLELPAALPILLGGLKIGATLSVIGAVVGEFIAPDRGLGFLISVARGQYDTALVFVGVFTLVAMALSLYGVVAWAESRFLWWRE